MAYPADLKYTKDHEWIRDRRRHRRRSASPTTRSSSSATSCYVELPEVGRSVTAGESFGSIESVKAVSELFAPMSGEVVEVNDALKDHPEVVNTDPHGTWMIKVKLCAARPIRERCSTPRSINRTSLG